MRKRINIPVPVLEDDDVSPKSYFREPLHYASIDLARTSANSYEGLLHLEEDALVPNMEVIEELESIRGMIETKSKDLHVREVSLSQSVSQWNSDVHSAQHLLEQLAENLLETAERRIANQFSAQVGKVNKLIGTLNHSIHKHESVRKSRLARAKGPPDVPPLPRALVPEFDVTDWALPFISADPDSRSRLVAMAALILVSSPTLTAGSCQFIVNAILNVAVSSIRHKFNAFFMNSVSSDMFGPPPGNESKFVSARQSILRKRLGLAQSPPDDASSLAVMITDVSIGCDKLVDVSAELEDEDMRRVWSQSISRFTSTSSESTKTATRLFTDPAVQTALSRQLRAKVACKDLRFRLAEFCIGTLDTASVTVLLKDVKRYLAEPVKADRSATDATIATLMYVVFRASEEGVVAGHINEIVGTIVQIFQSKQLGQASLRIASEWTQLLWYIVSKVVFYSQEGGNDTAFVDGFLRILDPIHDLSCMSPWRPVILRMIESNRIHNSVIGRVKSLLKKLE